MFFIKGEVYISAQVFNTSSSILDFTHFFLQQPLLECECLRAVSSNRHHQQVVNTEKRKSEVKVEPVASKQFKMGVCVGGVCYCMCLDLHRSISAKESLSFQFSALHWSSSPCYELLVAMVTLCFLIIADLLKQRWESDSSDNIL